MRVKEDTTVVVGIAMVGIALLIASIAMQGCSALTRIDNPVQPGYPCGTRAHSCSLEPLTCCWNDHVCGAAGTSCPAGACCYRGESYSAFPVLDGGVR